MSRNSAPSNALNIYVDSVSGNDGNSGLTTSLPLLTLSATQTKAAAESGPVRVNLARGSTWREQFDIPKNDVLIAVYGSGDMPVIDGADVVTTGWTQPNAALYPNVWSRSWTRASATTTASEYLGYWQAGVRTTMRGSLAALQAGSNGDWLTSSLTAQTSTVYIRSAADPNSDGILREITKRHYGINGHAQIITADRTGSIVGGPIEIKRCVGHYNALTGPKDGTARQLWLRDGNIHHMVTEGALSEDVLATEYHPEIAPTVFVAYRSNGDALDHMFRRCGVSMASRVVLAGSSAFYAHSSSPDAAANDISFEGSWAVNISFGEVSADTCTITGGYSRDGWDSHISVTGYTNTIRYFIGHDTSGIATGGSNRAGLRRLTNATYTPDLDLRDSAFIVRVGAGSYFANNYSTTVRNCLFVRPGNIVVGGLTDRSTANIQYSIMQGQRSLHEMASGYVGDYNVFYFEGAAAPQFQIDGAVYSALGTWQTATSQDANSVFLKNTDQTAGNANAFWLGVAQNINTGPYDGDFRINPIAYVYNGAGTRLTGTFADGTTSITAAGPQAYWDFNQRAVVVGVIPGFPTMPTSAADARTYMENPTAWDFYP